MSTEGFTGLRQVLDEIAAAEILQAIEDEHRRKYIQILVAPSEFEPVRQAMCSIDPQMESNVRSDSAVTPGRVFLIDTTPKLTKDFLAWGVRITPAPRQRPGPDG